MNFIRFIVSVSMVVFIISTFMLLIPPIEVHINLRLAALFFEISGISLAAGLLFLRRGEDR